MPLKHQQNMFFLFETFSKLSRVIQNLSNTKTSTCQNYFGGGWPVEYLQKQLLKNDKSPNKSGKDLHYTTNSRPLSSGCPHHPQFFLVQNTVLGEGVGDM